ncbi:hypothetical protein D6C84_04581 [Aureobasidium pullulans]|uniref:Uncharacterized protein n=1 Tax=Aureobasidium pullulans TaxID=5580 RepID=A0A4S9A507_AURPU|nr:hypothetical protein D6D20_08331 [Aureobasidium pullulans]THW74132.1 hypothetical protein D6D18_10155 [Aureobasidium pullulans]THZ83867.1 hypothetical protein D6C84_04581 [Aureobasidium pullulans]
MKDTTSSDAETKAALNRDRAIYESGANQANICKLFESGLDHAVNVVQIQNQFQSRNIKYQQILAAWEKHKREALPCATVNEIMLRLADLVTSDHEFLSAKFEHHVKKDSESKLADQEAVRKGEEEGDGEVDKEGGDQLSSYSSSAC